MLNESMRQIHRRPLLNSTKKWLILVIFSLGIYIAGWFSGSTQFALDQKGQMPQALSPLERQGLKPSQEQE